MSPDKKWKTTSKTNDLLGTIFIYLISLAVIFLFHPKFDLGFLALAVIFAFFDGYMFYYGVKYPHEIKRAQEEYNKRTPQEINKHMISGVWVGLSPILKGFALVFCAGVVMYLISLILNFLTK